MKTIRQWLRSQWLTLRCLDIVLYPPLGRLGVWLCNRYESRRYATRVEESIHATSGPFAAGGIFDIEFIDRTIPPRRARNNGNWLHSKKNLKRLIELAEKADIEPLRKVKVRGGLEYRIYPLPNNIPPQVTSDRSRGFGLQVCAVSRTDYEAIVEAAKKSGALGEKSSYLDSIGCEYFIDGWYAFIIAESASKETTTYHGN